MSISKYLNTEVMKSMNMQPFFPDDFILLSQFHFLKIFMFL